MFVLYFNKFRFFSYFILEFNLVRFLYVFSSSEVDATRKGRLGCMREEMKKDEK